MGDAVLLEELKREIESCRKCALAETRTQIVFGGENPNAEIMFIGEAPGANEDKLGLPFVGAAGKLLDQLLGSIGLERRDVYIANVLKCRPPQNRNPMAEEIELCKGYLLKQVELIRPKVVCTLGNFSTRLILGQPVSISKVHGQEFTGDGFVIMPSYHPAAALYTRATLGAIQEDFGKLKAIIEREPSRNQVDSEADELSEQLELF